MKSPIFTTALMGILAAATSLVAVYYYPWPEQDKQIDRVNEDLFEDYDYDKVRTIELSEFDGDRNELRTFQLSRRGDNWLIPNSSNFVSTAPDQISKAVNSLKGRVILEMMTDQQQDHLDYGVVDPDQFGSTTNRSALGSKISLEDRNGKEIAALIVGKSPKNDSTGTKRYVRIPGQPQVYVVEFDPTALSTDFRRWVSPNLLDLATPNNPTGLRPVEATIDSYRTVPQQLSANVRDQLYQVVVGLKQRFEILSLLAPSQEGSGISVAGAKLEPTTPTDAQQNMLMQITNYLGNTTFTKVRRKEKATARALAVPKNDVDMEQLKSLNEFGFQVAKYVDYGFLFNTTDGQISVKTEAGIIVSMLIGLPVGDGGLERYVIFGARLDESQFPMPEKPEGLDESADTDETKAYLRKVEDRKKKLAVARKLVLEFNKLHADWYYLVDENVITMLRPELSFGNAGSQGGRKIPTLKSIPRGN